MKYYMIDNNDSFVYNLAAYFEKLGQEIIVENVDSADIAKINDKKYSGLIISPGPGTPKQAIFSQKLIEVYTGKIPILGVCLGHQVIGHCFGADVCKGNRPMHGKISIIQNRGQRLFLNLPNSFNVTRYHSLIIDSKTLTPEFIIDAETEDGVIMAISHRKYPIYGLQFHPEALLTEYGYEIIENFIDICKAWEDRNDKHQEN
ncbi:anthranilate synthase component II [Aminipila sp.]|uniref:anthranilate synthase component II n=1 Tax=Aminipila sp. TaxID=2060095 RepID=UPI00289EE183|nr:aminodeoxychorismate/anthranilate synthase component II [Aminipila sp.]